MKALIACGLMSALFLSGCSKILGDDLSCSSTGAQKLVIDQVTSNDALVTDLEHTATGEDSSLAQNYSDGLVSAKKAAREKYHQPAQDNYNQAEQQCEAKYRAEYVSENPSATDDVDQRYNDCLAHGAPPQFARQNNSNLDETAGSCMAMLEQKSPPNGGTWVPLAESAHGCNQNATSILAEAAGHMTDDIHKAIDAAHKTTVFSLADIRTESKDADTGKVSCDSTIHAKLDDDWGESTKELPYTVERTSDGKLYVTLTD